MTGLRFERLLADLARRITAAAVDYEARWTLGALHRVDPDIAARLGRQIGLWLEAGRAGSEDEIVTQGEALVRGYRRAIEVMTTSGRDDDAYVLGRCSKTGTVIAVGHQMASADRVAALYPGAVFWDADELAGVLGDPEAFQRASAVKRIFPGAVATETRSRTSA